MKKEQLYEALGDINENYVNEAHLTAKKTARPIWLKWAAMAACLCLVLGLGIGGFNLIGNNDSGMYGEVIEDREPIIVTIKNWRDEGFVCTVVDADIHTFITVGGDVYIEFNDNTKVNGTDFKFDSENPNAQECGLTVGTQVKLYFDAVNYKDGQDMAYSLGATEIIPQ